MPVYEYGCRKCGHEFERFQRISDPEVKTCPECRSRQVERLISSSAFHLKGSGWYVTDYARKDNGNGGSASRESTDTGADASSSTEAKAEAKSAKKAEGRKKSKKVEATA